MLELLLCFAHLLSGKILCYKPNLCFQSLDSLKRRLTRQARLIPACANAGASSKESSKNKRELCGSSSVPVFFRFLRRRKMPKAPHGCSCDTVGTILGHESRLGPTTAHDKGRKEWASTPSPVARPRRTVSSVHTSYYGCLVLTCGAALFFFGLTICSQKAILRIKSTKINCFFRFKIAIIRPKIKEKLPDLCIHSSSR
jgi:hypothetical protein